MDLCRAAPPLTGKGGTHALADHTSFQLLMTQNPCYTVLALLFTMLRDSFVTKKSFGALCGAGAGADVLGVVGAGVGVPAAVAFALLSRMAAAPRHSILSQACIGKLGLPAQQARRHQSCSASATQFSHADEKISPLRMSCGMSAMFALGTSSVPMVYTWRPHTSPRSPVMVAVELALFICTCGQQGRALFIGRAHANQSASACDG